MTATLRMLAAGGHDVERISKQFGFSEALAAQAKDIVVDSSQLAAFLEAAAIELDNRVLGLDLARAMRRGAFGLAEFAIRASPNVLEVLRRVADYIPLVNRVAVIEFKQSAAEGKLTHKIRGHPRGICCHDNEFFVALLCENILEQTGGRARPSMIMLAHPQDASRRELERRFGATVEYDAGHNGLVYPRTALLCDIESADPALLRVLDEQARLVLSGTSESVTSFVAQVREAVFAELGPTGPSLSQVATRISMSTRVLQRRLSEEGTTFRDVVESVRAQVACARLAQTRTRLDTLANDLGYSDVGGFVRAFKRWTGHTPNSYRRQREIGSS